MNGIQQPFSDAELKKLEEHKQWYATLSGFTCIACGMPRDKKKFGRFGVWRPNRKYTKVLLPVTYILDDECQVLLPEVLYERIEKWLVDHKHLVL